MKYETKIFKKYKKKKNEKKVEKTKKIPKNLGFLLTNKYIY
jgi:hypothetical protein